MLFIRYLSRDTIIVGCFLVYLLLKKYFGKFLERARKWIDGQKYFSKIIITNIAWVQFRTSIQ
jgi:hypothetical protein